MHDQRVRSSRNDGARQPVQRHFRVLIVDADAAFDRDRHPHRALHRGDTFRHQIRLSHQAGTEAAILHAVRRAADIEVDFIVAEILTDLRAGREVRRVRSAELQRHRMFAGVEPEQPLAVAVDHRPGRQHLGVEPRAPRQQPVKDAAMPVSPVHHGCDGKSM